MPANTFASESVSAGRRQEVESDRPRQVLEAVSGENGFFEPLKVTLAARDAFGVLGAPSRKRVALSIQAPEHCSVLALRWARARGSMFT